MIPHEYIPEEGPIERWFVRTFWLFVFLMVLHGVLELLR